ncbi:helix-turn-helix domain-containing protein [Peristeroidobacter agariperforans]|uniref:helix-turn-helix domain-containing protein n=1 Tax=Peristeroidobacter agariperforans TaxID=268404 RepID=UPI00101C089C|nr:helix-turn-helix domain-containing protein [Peristeroidobacter agariperforans]
MATTSSALTFANFVTRIHAHGLDEAAAQLAPFLRTRYVQLERGMACSRGSAARLDQLCVGYVSADRHKVEWLEVPRGRMLVVVPTSGRARLGTTSVARGRVIVAHGPTELTVCSERDYRSTFVSLPDRGVGEFIGQNYVVTGSVRVRVLPAAEAAIESFDTCARELTETAGASSDVLLEVCETWLREAPDDNVAFAPSTARCQAAIRARQYIDEHLERPLTLGAVCQASYSSPRALEYGFREIFGVSPIAYLRCARLSRVRRELHGSAYTSGRITQLAMKWGFWHLSQFSKDYYDLFGELPSVTLGRASGRVDRSGCDCVETTARRAVAEEL